MTEWTFAPAYITYLIGCLGLIILIACLVSLSHTTRYKIIERRSFFYGEMTGAAYIPYRRGWLRWRRLRDEAGSPTTWDTETAARADIDRHRSTGKAYMFRTREINIQ